MDRRAGWLPRRGRSHGYRVGGLVGDGMTVTCRCGKTLRVTQLRERFCVECSKCRLFLHRCEEQALRDTLAERRKRWLQPYLPGLGLA